MKNAIFITVRTGSTRLPKKCLLKLNGIAAIEFLIKRVKKSKQADLIVLCTTELKEDQVLCRIASQQGIEYFMGPVKDKLMRWNKAAEKFDIDFFVTADGDDLFCEPELIDLAFKQYETSSADFIESDNLPCGAFTYGIRVSALKKVCEIKASQDTEMMWDYFKQAGLFRIEKLLGVPIIYRRPEIRMTLDYPDDFKFFKTVIAGLGGTEKDFNLMEIINFLDHNPDVIKINQYLQKEFKENQERLTKVVFQNGRKK